MRLLNAHTLKLKEFIGELAPKYVVLSHTWGEEEVTFQDITSADFDPTTKKGFSKIKHCCIQARLDGFEWAWIDTCCIDKTSSSELSEAINSMFQWYEESQKCYAYLVDVFVPPLKILECEGRVDEFRASRWFTRGWTLQELLAPSIVEFYNADWEEIGTRLSLRNVIEDITGIRTPFLRSNKTLGSCSVAEKMSWASRRQTTRIEDTAYCLLGIFNVNMPLIYGEGTNSFIRLQEEVMKTKEDYSIFLWTEHNTNLWSSILAPSPSNFCTTKWCQACSGRGWDYSDIIHTPALKAENQDGDSINNVFQYSEPPTLTARGLKVGLLLGTPPNEEQKNPMVPAYFNYKVGFNEDLLCIMLTRSTETAVFARASNIVRFSSAYLDEFIFARVYVSSFTLRMAPPRPKPAICGSASLPSCITNVGFGSAKSSVSSGLSSQSIHCPFNTFSDYRHKVVVGGVETEERFSVAFYYRTSHPVCYIFLDKASGYGSSVEDFPRLSQCTDRDFKVLPSGAPIYAGLRKTTGQSASTGANQHEYVLQVSCLGHGG